MSYHYPPITWGPDPSQVPARPTVRLSGQPSRDYAIAADSRVLKDESRVILSAAARGVAVDAYELNKALTDAMSSAATRCASSSERRALTKRIRHLSYITQAVLESHADGLPTQIFSDQPGDVERGLREARQEVESLTQSLRDWKARAAAQEERADDYSEQIEALTRRVRNIRAAQPSLNEAVAQQNRDLFTARQEVARQAEELAKQNRILFAERQEIARQDEQVKVLREALAKADDKAKTFTAALVQSDEILNYALDQMAPAYRERVLGYRDGVNSQ